MRVVTRADFDGIMCAVLLKQVENITDVAFSHPKDVQDGKVNITPQDIICNLPYDPRCAMWFDHHSSEEERIQPQHVAQVKGAFKVAPSAARVVYDYYGPQKLGRFASILDEVDRVDAAQLTMDDVTNPKGWILLSYIMDPRTGLGRYQFRMNNFELMQKLVEWIPSKSADEILAIPDVKERVDLYLKQQKEFADFLKKHSRQDGNVVISDLRGIQDVPTGNRFLIYTLFPTSNVSLRVFDGPRGQFHVVAVGHNIFNRTCKTNVGELMQQYGGGGHRGAGTCQLDPHTSDAKVAEIVATLKQNG